MEDHVWYVMVVYNELRDSTTDNKADAKGLF